MILVGHVLDRLRELPDESVHCCVSSPPYFGLRNYGVEGQIGLEASLPEYIDVMVRVYAEVFRVLRSDGTCWINIGDSYSERGNSGGNNGITNIQASAIRERGYVKREGFKRKELLGVPWRLAFALQDAGWYLRSDIIWSKPNPMPESVRDRPTKAHEYIFLLTKSPKYFYDADAIRRPEGNPNAGGGPVPAAHRLVSGGEFVRTKPIKMPDGWDTGPGGHGSFHRNGREKGQTKNERSGQETKVNLNANWDAAEEAGTVKGANARTVWTIATQAYPEAHFATFPEEIPRRCIMAGCPEGGTVLDPFLGSGTTAALAVRLGRKYIGIELNEEYAKLAEKRINAETPSMFSGEAA